MIEPTVARWIKGIEYASLTKLLSDFRHQLDRDLGAGIEQSELNGALLLNDLCAFLKLGEQQRREVLGRKGTAFVDRVLAANVDLEVKH